MLSLLIYDSNNRESHSLSEYARDTVAYLSDDKLNVEESTDIIFLKDYLTGKNLLDMAFLDVTIKEGVSVAIQLRQFNQEAELLLLADASVSPMRYLNPSIRAASLLLRPFSKEQGKKVIAEFVRFFYRNRESDAGEDVFVLESKEGKMTIPFSKIYYLEVREKRVYVRLKNTEYFKYGTLTQIMEDLSDQFIRCHRSFVVNKSHIRQVKISEGIICLTDDIEIPLSRSYKGDIREYLYELREKGNRRDVQP